MVSTSAQVCIVLPILSHAHHSQVASGSRRTDQPFVQHPTATRNPRHDGPRCDVEHPGDLHIGELLDVAEPHGLTKHLGKRIDDRLQVSIEGIPQQELFGRLDMGLPTARRSSLDNRAVHRYRIPPSPPALIEERIVRDRVEPGLQVGSWL